MKLFRVQALFLSMFIFAGWAVMQKPSLPAAQVSTDQASVTPQRGQSSEEQKKDLAECYEIAKAKTGIDPSTFMSLSKKGTGASVADAASAAVDAANRAAAASSSGGGEASASKQAKLNKFHLANQACLQARGYLVKGQAPLTAPPADQPKP